MVRRHTDHLNNQREPESLGNVTPSDIHFARAKEIQTRRKELRRKTPDALRRQHAKLLQIAA